jgi:propanol-preferring alcohol dehydrogenase
MLLNEIARIQRKSEPLVLSDIPIPSPKPDEVRVRIAACGVCHTELDEIEGRTPPGRLPVVPGHEIVGHIDALGTGVKKRQIGEHVGIGWIHHSSGEDDENLSEAFRATGRDVNGGYAEYMTVPASYAFPIPDRYASAAAAPLLCAGAVGYRSLRLTGLENGETLGLTGFGASAHLVLQLARYLYPAGRVCVFARNEAQRRFARELGADWAGATEDRAPFPLDAIIDTTPAWLPIREALANLRPGGRLVINAIRKEDEDKSVLTELDYARHLWMEKEIKSVANITGRDIAEFLPLAASIPIISEVTRYPLEDANHALIDLKFGGARGAKVLEIAQA